MISCRRCRSLSCQWQQIMTHNPILYGGKMNVKLTSRTWHLCSVTFQVWLTELQFVASFSRRQTHREPFMQRHYCLHRKRKSFFVYIDTVQFHGGPIVREYVRAELNFCLLSSSGEGNMTQRNL